MAKKNIDKRTVRRSDADSIANLMSHFIQANNLEKGFEKIKVEEKWVELMGKGVQSYTEKVTLKSGTLLVRITSPALRNELEYGKDKIQDMMNEALGEELVKKVVLC